MTTNLSTLPTTPVTSNPTQNLTSLLLLRQDLQTQLAILKASLPTKNKSTSSTSTPLPNPKAVLERKSRTDHAYPDPKQEPKGGGISEKDKKQRAKEKRAPPIPASETLPGTSTANIAASLYALGYNPPLPLPPDRSLDIDTAVVEKGDDGAPTVFPRDAASGSRRGVSDRCQELKLCIAMVEVEIELLFLRDGDSAVAEGE